ncbi:MAG: response regulator [Taibaiella sp.]|nr:response regulator [Taibaiella sp.]
MKTIFLVDDVAIANFIMKKLIRIILPSAVVHDYTNSAVAFESIGTLHPDIILLDLNMPDFSGFEFLQKMSKLGMNHKVVILAASTSNADKEEVKTYKNVTGYFVKPIDRRQLKQILLGSI